MVTEINNKYLGYCQELCDKGKAVSVKYTRLLPGLVVSTAIIHLPVADTEYDQIETWIFSKMSDQDSVQVIHSSVEQAIKAHEHMVANMKKKYNLIEITEIV